ncbi:MAG: NfeD family protein [Gammaproteobacteria bacterium]|nr:NfeD family protein [Gammaproteobacteria bacterium]
MTWWAWTILGAVLFGAELVAIDAQFYLVFLGLSAALVGALSGFGIDMPEWVQWLIFAGLSLVSMFTFRKMLYEKIRGNAPGFLEGLDGETLVIAEDLAVGQTSRASFRGSDWTVVNEGAGPLSRGDKVRIRRTEGLTLYIEDDTSH